MAGAVRRPFVTRLSALAMPPGVAWVAALLAMLALFVAGPVPAAAPATSQCANVTQTGIIAGTTPILFVHGIDSGPATWTTGTVSGTSVAPMNYIDGALGAQVTGYTFDWSQYSGLQDGSTLSWVTGPPAPGPGQLLAQAIKCVAAKAGHKVIIVAHSMGGLLTEYSSSVGSVAGDIAAVFTLGTPFQGSWLDSTATGALGWLTQAIGGYCSVKPSGGIEALCRVVSERDDPGMIGMRTDAPAKQGWHALNWPGGFPVFPLAASIRATSWQPLPLFGPQLTFADFGDFVVGTSSELGSGTTPTVTCTVPVTGAPALATLLGAVTASSCFHTNEPDNRTLLDTIISTIKQRSLVPAAVPSAGTKNPAPGLVTASIPVVSCPTSLGIDRPSVPLPGSRPVAVPQSLAAGLSLYADTQGVMELLGPKGWSCAAFYGADGSGGVTVYPRGAGPSSPAAITGSETSACFGCTLAQACQLFPSAAKALRSALGEACPVRPPTAQKAVSIAAGIEGFEDPPGVKGDGQPSGGPYPANGVMTYHPSAPDGSWQETCTLPASETDVCTAVLNTFVSWYGQR